MARKSAALTRPEQVFFDDPAIDRLMGVLMALATEHYVMKDRLTQLERQLAAAGHVDLSRLDRQDGQLPTDEADAAAFAQSLLEPLLGRQQATGLGGKFTLARQRRRR